MSLVLEVIVQSVEDALQAEAGGADRLEVVREIDREGLTPPLALVEAIGRATRLPLRVMVREQEGFEPGMPAMLASMCDSARALSDLGVDGIVTGFSTGGALDVDAIRAVLGAAPDVRVTLHRAFDSVDDPVAAARVARTLPQIDRILTSGGAGPWTDRCVRLARYAAAAGPRITMLAGGGVDEEALRILAAGRVVREAHVGRAGREPQHAMAPVSAARVARLKRIIAEAAGT